MANEETKRRFGFELFEDPTDDEKLQFFQFQIDVCRQKTEWRNDDISEYFADDFRSFTAEDFENIDVDSRRTLRDLLRERDLYVPKGMNIRISNALYSVVKEELPWPQDEKIQGGETTIDETNSVQEKDGKDVLLKNLTSKTVKNATQVHTDDSSVTKRKENLSNLFKAYYGDSEKYSGITTDNFDWMYVLFLERCDQSDVSTDNRTRAFSIMLTSTARQYCLDVLRPRSLSVDDLANHMKHCFYTLERRRALSREWDSLPFVVIMSNTPGKTPSECLELLIDKMSDIQSTLPDENCSDTIFRDKLLNSVRDVSDCRLAYHKLADTVQGVISDLHASLATSNLATANSSNASNGLDINYVNRRYVHRQQNCRPSNRNNRDRKCIACGPDGCWLTNHSTKERLDAFPKNKSIRQFIASLKDEDDDLEDDDRHFADVLEDITTHVIEMNINDDKDDHSYGAVYSHLANIDDTDNCAALTASLQEAITIHAFTAKPPTSRYAGTCYGVMLDTGCARESSGCRAQYLEYCKAAGRRPQVDSSKAKHCQFGIGSAMSDGTAVIEFRLGDMWMQFDAHIVSADVPILLGLSHMDHLGIFFNNLDDRPVHLHPDSP